MGPSPAGGQLSEATKYSLNAGATFEFSIPKGSKAFPTRVLVNAGFKSAFGTYGTPSCWPGRNTSYVAGVDSDDEGADYTTL